MANEKDKEKTANSGTKAAAPKGNEGVLEILQRPFEEGQIKQRKGRGGSKFDYIEAHSVIDRLNEAFGIDWSFEVVSHEQMASELVVLGKLSVDGVVKMQFGGKEIEVYSKGNRKGEVISESDNIKAATSDALKKCASLFGIGLYLYAGSGTGSSTGSGTGEGNSNGKEENGSIGDLKNRIIAGEKEIRKLNQINAAVLRDQHLESTNLNHPKAKLEKYLYFLLSEYADVMKGDETNGRGDSKKSKGDGNGKQEPQSNTIGIGDIKNQIVTLEKEIRDITEVGAADLRDEHLGSQSLNHPKETLEKYLEFLIFERGDASKDKD